MRTSRPLLTGILALASVAIFPSAAFAAPAPPAEPHASEHSAVIGENTLRALAEEAGIEIGVAVNADLLASNGKYRNIVNTQYSSVTAENVMKWEALNPAQGVYDWAAAEALIANAEANGQVVRGHTLVWHNQLPAWLTTGDFTAEELRDILRESRADGRGALRRRHPAVGRRQRDLQRRRRGQLPRDDLVPGLRGARAAG